MEGGLEGGKKGGWGGEEEMGGKDCHDFLHRGVVVTCNRAVVDTVSPIGGGVVQSAVLIIQVEVDTLEIPSIENIKEEVSCTRVREGEVRGAMGGAGRSGGRSNGGWWEGQAEVVGGGQWRMVGGEMEDGGRGWQKW